MTRQWKMIGTAMLGAMAASSFAQVDPPRAGAPVPNPQPFAQAAEPATPVAPAGQPGQPPRPAKAPRAPVAEALPPAAGNVFPTAKREKVTYLGVVTSAAPAALREQLKLAQGAGLVVDAVEPGTAAEKAGVKQHDVVEKLDDQMLINPEQLSTLLRSKRPGDEVTLAIVRQGERQSLKARLEEKEGDVLPHRAFGGADFQAVPMNPGGNGGNFQYGFGGNGIGGGVAFGGRGDRVQTFAADGPNARRMMVRTVDGKQTTEWADDEVVISIERAGGQTNAVTIKDQKTGKTLYAGTPKEVYPQIENQPELRDKLKKAEGAATREPRRIQLQAPAPTIRGMGGGGQGGKVVRWQDDNHVLLLRMAGRSPTYLLALSKKDGRTVFDGPVVKEADRRSVPAEIAEEFQMICGQPDMAQELGGGDGAAGAPATDAPRPGAAGPEAPAALPPTPRKR